MKHIAVLFTLFACSFVVAQTTTVNDAWKKDYRATAPKINDLVHTKLAASFDYTHAYLNGKVWITLTPHFYPTDSLQLDAKGMDIHSVELVSAGNSSKLNFKYDGLFLNISLNKTYKKGDKYTVLINYTAKPNELVVKGSAAISDAKGLYFINPTGEDKNKPTQIWTQGETEGTSVWIPTIDRPNQKTTNEFSLTVPAKYVTLSNGKLVSQINNANKTRTDNWKMDQPHSPYLFFIGVGDYAIVKDHYKGKEVNYYVEKNYEKVARKIFGLTPEMMQFFSEKVTGIEYPWVKYSQIIGRDYVSGAMENTTATLHQESAQQDARQLVDGNEWEGTVAHELFHQWFGDLVTAESWSNLTVNESFADYSQLLWQEYKYGADAAGFENYKEMQNYLVSGSQSKDLVRFYYADKEDMFDAVSYQKGGRILHMLRNLVGDQAFFASLNKYLNTNKFGNGSAHKLRLAFEEVTGKDLNWFFNQWYFGNGHPRLDISSAYDAEAHKAMVVIKQTQSGEKVFRLPMAVDIYQGNQKTRHKIVANSKADTFYFAASVKPDLINVDADKITLAEKKDTKTLAEFIFQYNHAGNYLDRREAIEYASKKMSDTAAFHLIVKALKDPFDRIRAKALASFASSKLEASVLASIENIATNDAKRTVRADAIDILAKQKNAKYASLFVAACKDSSYTVAGAGLEALALIDSVQAFKIANNLSKEEAKGRLSGAISNVIIEFGDESSFDFVVSSFTKMPLSQEKFTAIASLVNLLEKVKTKTNFEKGVDEIVKFRDLMPEQIRVQTTPYINNMILKGLADKKDAAGDKVFADYVRGKISK